MGGLFQIYQDFATTVGNPYAVSFFYRARVNDSEQFRFSVGALSASLSDHVVGSWSQYSNTFIANQTQTRIQFTTTDAGTLGNFLDGVRVTSVPEPGTLALLGLGLAGLGAWGAASALPESSQPALISRDPASAGFFVSGTRRRRDADTG
jgi:hypothetical protein